MHVKVGFQTISALFPMRLMFELAKSIRGTVPAVLELLLYVCFTFSHQPVILSIQNPKHMNVSFQTLSIDLILRHNVIADDERLQLHSYDSTRYFFAVLNLRLPLGAFIVTS